MQMAIQAVGISVFFELNLSLDIYKRFICRIVPHVKGKNNLLHRFEHNGFLVVSELQVYIIVFFNCW